MKIRQIQDILQAEILCGQEMLDMQVDGACGADLMSDVLAGTKHNTLLLTGLCTIQSIRTAEMVDVIAIVFVRGKSPTPDMLSLAEQLGIAVLRTPLMMFEACGMLYQGGLGKEDGGESGCRT